MNEIEIVSPHLTIIISLTVNGLYSLINRYRVDEWIRKEIEIWSTRDSLQIQGQRVTVKEWENTLHANGNQKKAGATILTSNNPDGKSKTAVNDKEVHYTMTKRSIHMTPY